MSATLAVVLLVAVATLWVLLWAPIDLVFRTRREEVATLDIQVSWLRGLARTEIHKSREALVDDPVPAEPKPYRARRGSFSRGMRIARSEGFLRGAARCIGRIVTGLEVRDARLRVRVGLDDPADTGRLFGYVFPVSRALTSAARADIDLSPDFTGESLTFDGHAHLRVVPARVLGPALAFTLSWPTLRAIWAARS